MLMLIFRCGLGLEVSKILGKELNATRKFEESKCISLEYLGDVGHLLRFDIIRTHHRYKPSFNLRLTDEMCGQPRIHI